MAQVTPGVKPDEKKLNAQLAISCARRAGALIFAVWEAAVKDGKVDPSKVQVLWQTPAYPDYQWTIRGDADSHFGANFTAHVTTALLDMKDPDLLESFPRSGFIPASNDDYAPIKTVGEQLGLLR